MLEIDGKLRDALAKYRKLPHVTLDHIHMKTMEELAELSVEVAHVQKKKCTDDLVAEAADALICIAQIIDYYLIEDEVNNAIVERCLRKI